MNFKKQSKRTALLSLVLAAALVTGAFAVGAYTGPAKRTSPVIRASGTAPNAADLIQGAQEDNYHLRAVLAAEKCYEESDIAGFSVALPFLGREERNAFVERAYEDGNVSFFSVLANRMDGEYLEDWIVRASEEHQAAFLSILLKAADRDGELDALEAELEAEQLAKYEEHGITREGKNYYYKSQLVRVFLDARPDRSCYTLDMNPLGKVDIKIVRDTDGQIQGVAYMTKEEAEELFGEWDDPEDSAEMDTLDFRGTTYYLVFNEAQLRSISTGRYGLDQNYLQQADIRLSSEEWVPIGTAERPFTGSYNGNGFEIKGLTMKDPKAELAGLFGVGDGAEIYNVTLRDYDVAYAGRQTSRKTVGPILAQGLNGSKCYDNFLYPKELDGGTVIRIPVDYDRVQDGGYCWLGEYTLSVGDRIQYNVSAETGNGLAIGFADMEHKPDEVTYCTVSNRRVNGTLQCDADFNLSDQSAAVGRFRLFLHAMDGELGNVKGSITLTLAEGDQDFPEIPPLTANDILALSREELPAAARRLLDQCASQTWYLLHYEGRQYIWYDGLSGSYLYIPFWEDGGWRVAIRSRSQTGAGYVLLSFPGGIPLTVTFDGDSVPLTQIGI